MKPFPASSADWSDADAAGRSAVPERSRLHPTVLLMACAHMMVDGYGNIYAPLLPLLIPRLDLTLAAAGTLTMLFQLSASVAQSAMLVASSQSAMLAQSIRKCRCAADALSDR